MTKKLFVGILALLVCLCFALPVSADEFGVGPAWVDGHSDDGKYGMNNEGPQSFGGVLHFERDKGWMKTFGNNKIGVDPGMVGMFFRWTKTENREKTTCKGYECEEPRYDYETTTQDRYETCTTKEYGRNESVNSYILGAYLKPYLEIMKGKVRVFGLGGPGLEFADDGTHFAAVVGGGVQYRFSKRFAASLTQYEVFSDPTGEYRRFDATVLSFDYLF